MKRQYYYNILHGNTMRPTASIVANELKETTRKDAAPQNINERLVLRPMIRNNVGAHMRKICPQFLS